MNVQRSTTYDLIERSGVASGKGEVLFWIEPTFSTLGGAVPIITSGIPQFRKFAFRNSSAPLNAEGAPGSTERLRACLKFTVRPAIEPETDSANARELFLCQRLRSSPATTPP